MSKHDLGKLRLAPNRSYLRSRRAQSHQKLTVAYKSEVHLGQTESWWLNAPRESFTRMASECIIPETRVTHTKPID